MKQIDVYKIAMTLNDYEKGIGVIRVPPIWGRDMTAQTYFEHMRTRVEAGRRLLLPGELGCALAHVNTYKNVINRKLPALIIEEDIDLNEKNFKFINDIVNRFKIVDFISFAKYKHIFLKTRINNEIYVADTSKGFWGAAIYFISPRMACYLKKQHLRYIDLADNWQEFFVDCPYVPYYVPLYEHSGAGSRIGARTSQPQNASLRDALQLRILRWRMTFLAKIRHARNVRTAIRSQRT